MWWVAAELAGRRAVGGERTGGQLGWPRSNSAVRFRQLGSSSNHPRLATVDSTLKVTAGRDSESTSRHDTTHTLLAGWLFRRVGCSRHAAVQQYPPSHGVWLERGFQMCDSAHALSSHRLKVVPSLQSLHPSGLRLGRERDLKTCPRRVLTRMVPRLHLCHLGTVACEIPVRCLGYYAYFYSFDAFLLSILSFSGAERPDNSHELNEPFSKSIVTKRTRRRARGAETKQDGPSQPRPRSRATCTLIFACQ